MPIDDQATRPVVRVLVPTGMLGGGFPEASIERGIARGADIVAVDGRSCDSR